MKTLVLLAFLLSSGVARALADSPAVPAEPRVNKAVQEREAYCAATTDVDQLIKSRKLKEAEEAVLRYEPQFARKWGVGRFGYVCRMEIGQAYLDRGEAKEALRLFKSATPGGGCGNCMSSQHVERNIRVARIYESRLNFPAALASYVGALPGTMLGGGLFRVAFGLVYCGGATSIPILALAYFVVRQRRRRRSDQSESQAEAAPNGGPAKPLHNSAVSEGPPSVN